MTRRPAACCQLAAEVIGGFHACIMMMQSTESKSLTVFVLIVKSLAWIDIDSLGCWRKNNVRVLRHTTTTTQLQPASAKPSEHGQCFVDLGEAGK